MTVPNPYLLPRSQSLFIIIVALTEKLLLRLQRTSLILPDLLIRWTQEPEIRLKPRRSVLVLQTAIANVTSLTPVGIPDRLTTTRLLLFLFLLARPLFTRTIDLSIRPRPLQKTNLPLAGYPLPVLSTNVVVLRLKLEFELKVPILYLSFITTPPSFGPPPAKLIPRFPDKPTGTLPTSSPPRAPTPPLAVYRTARQNFARPFLDEFDFFGALPRYSFGLPPLS